MAHTIIVKVVELAPAFGLDDKVRKALHQDALKIARHVKYRNAGTVEFMVDKNGDYYFLEVNPRIQVQCFLTLTLAFVFKSQSFQYIVITWKGHCI